MGGKEWVGDELKEETGSEVSKDKMGLKSRKEGAEKGKSERAAVKESESKLQ